MSKEQVELINYAEVDLETGEFTTTEEVLENSKELVVEQFKMGIAINSGVAVIENAIRENNAIAEMIEKVLKSGTHYGYIPGTKQKTLFQGGADVLSRIYGVLVEFEKIDRVIDLSNNLIDFEYKAIAYWDGKKIGEATASANSLEQKFKSHFWDSKNDTLKKGKSPYDIKNTILQMAQKRAKVRLIRNVFGISAVFTQDLEDMAEAGATKDDKLAIYPKLYEYETSNLGKNKTDRRNWLKQNLLKELTAKHCEGRGMRQWTDEDITALYDALENTDKINAWITERLKDGSK